MGGHYAGLAWPPSENSVVFPNSWELSGAKLCTDRDVTIQNRQNGKQKY